MLIMTLELIDGTPIEVEVDYSTEDGDIYVDEWKILSINFRTSSEIPVTNEDKRYIKEQINDGLWKALEK